ncbi:hypothetical protein BJ508DRAFT_309562 [Ascobolus immersus RN42]|uniref:Uncharacterized protein n=1 Tax=Ascobolus immersus RN42 TaxID=1160509 RepID=A0A3N4HYA0_ASCIM|nr:hypothetical protein BJ508DRAFT_309562 [Ascobolus immersus RN42]
MPFDYQICFTQSRTDLDELHLAFHRRLYLLDIPYISSGPEAWKYAFDANQLGENCMWVRLMGTGWENDVRLLDVPDVTSITQKKRPLPKIDFFDSPWDPLNYWR